MRIRSLRALRWTLHAAWDPDGRIAFGRSARSDRVPSRGTHGRGTRAGRGRRNHYRSGDRCNARLCRPRRRLAAGPDQVNFTVRGSAEQVEVTGAKPSQKLKLVDRAGKVVQTKKAGSLGGIVFRRVDPGGGYRVRESGGGESPEFKVLTDRPAPPNTKIYDQSLPAGGYGYLQTRDGTKLAIDVHLPGPADKGPYPTLVEYSGYGYANPNGPQSSIQPIAAILGFAVVDVNMRGTGCSGGAFDYFERLQSLDGYDVVETVARQPWVLNDKVGMMGVSYGGISQLFVAETRPPHLAAIAPLSVIDNSQTTLYPGGILNTGFALQWAEDRVHDAEPASPTGGQPWAYQRIQDGDKVCEANQDLHPEAVDLIKQDPAQQLLPAQGRRPAVADHVRPQDRRARCSSPASGRTSRPAATAPPCRRTSPARTASGSPSPTASTSTRSTRRRSTAGTTSWSSSSPSETRATARARRPWRPRSTRR